MNMMFLPCFAVIRWNFGIISVLFKFYRCSDPLEPLLLKYVTFATKIRMLKQAFVRIKSAIRML